MGRKLRQEVLLVKSPEGRLGISDVSQLSGISGLSVCLHLLFCSSAQSCCSFCLILFCSWPILLTSFPLNLHFLKGRLCCVALGVFFFSSQEYFSWWYVQHILPYGTGTSLYTFIVFVICNCFVHSLKKPLNLVCY